MADQRPEPSMEDILASIKRIIADDPMPAPPAASPPVARSHAPAQQRPAAADPSPPWPERADPPSPDSILELTHRLPEPGIQPAPAARMPEPSAPVQRAVERLRQAEAEIPQPVPRPVPRDLLPRTPASAPHATGGDLTINAMVRELLQPMLAEWIDRNLPDMVERLVRAEIRRMTEKDG